MHPLNPLSSSLSPFQGNHLFFKEFKAIEHCLQHQILPVSESDLPHGLSPLHGEVVLCFRKLYGYETHLNYNKHNKRKKGLLEEIPSVRYEKGMIMTRETDLEKVKDMISE
ncbi:hypothetical protein Thermo_01246 [Thermoplasmatales archaeon]|nr:hypothetical protein Thermo_01246 [Thermoplasmatales archaeon]